MKRRDAALNHNVKKTTISQYPNQTLDHLRHTVKHDASALISRALRGGTIGIVPDEKFSIHFVSDELLDELGFTYAQCMDVFHSSSLEMIHDDDREDYTAELQLCLKSGAILDRIVRIQKSDSSYMWARDIGQLTQVEDCPADLFLILRTNVTSLLSSHQQLLHKIYLYESRLARLEALTANIPGGVCEVYLDEHYTLEYASAGFYNLWGYTEHQLAVERQNQLRGLIYENDRDSVQEVIVTAYAQKKEEFEFEHRIVRRDGSMIWVLARGSFTTMEDRLLFSCAVININNRKQIEETARISEQRFRIALAQTENTIFEYDIAARVMIHSDRAADYYGIRQRTENVPESLVEDGVIHPDSAEVFLDMYSRICSGTPTASCIIRARLIRGGYVWRRITMTTIFNESGTAVQAVGFLEDIDEQVRREEDLRNQSERDDLTGVYKRGALIRKINQELNSESQCSLGALFVIDVDNFKNVNDQFGHMFGDFVLSESARRMLQVFPEQAVIGRLGGDEFMIYVPANPSHAAILSYAAQLLQAFHQKFCNGSHTAHITCSIGFAEYPNDGVRFEELYQKADTALYDSKNLGKDQVSYYKGR